MPCMLSTAPRLTAPRLQRPPLRIVNLGRCESKHRPRGFRVHTLRLQNRLKRRSGNPYSVSLRHVTCIDPHIPHPPCSASVLRVLPDPLSSAYPSSCLFLAPRPTTQTPDRTLRQFFSLSDP
eukprot:3656163-Rhodomonas_salina.1